MDRTPAKSLNRSCPPWVAAAAILWLLPAGLAAQGVGIWTTAAELAPLPVVGVAWDQLLAEAQLPIVAPSLADQNSGMNVRALAKALVYARTGLPGYRDELIAIFDHVSNGGFYETENVSLDSLAISRELGAFVIAADLIGLDSDADTAFRTWLGPVRTEILADGRSLLSTHEDRPNNWGTNAGASRIAAAVYLGDAVDLDAAAAVFKGWLGDRQSYAGFNYGGSAEDLSWQADPQQPVGINPLGATRFGANIDGALPEEMRRHFLSPWDPGDYPPFPQVNYSYEALQGALVQAVMLHRQGYDVWNWEDQALLRAFRWLHQPHPDGPSFPATLAGDDGWLSHLVNYYYGESFPENAAPAPGKNLGWTAWTHGCPDIVTDADADSAPDSCDNCPGLGNPDQADADQDGIGDLCDNCVTRWNPAVDPGSFEAFRTYTGNQVDDDADGYGNACDADYDNDSFVNYSDVADFSPSFFQAASTSTCGISGSAACAQFDHTASGRVNFGDVGVLSQLFFVPIDTGTRVKCAICPLACSGDACP